MSIFSKLRRGGPASDKERKFRELKAAFRDEDMLLTAKATWLTSRGNWYGSASRFDEAVADFREALTISNDHVPARLGLAIALRETGCLDDALATLDSIPLSPPNESESASVPQHAVLQQYIGVYLLWKDFPTALSYAHRALAALTDYRRWLDTAAADLTLAMDSEARSRAEEEAAHLAALISELEAQT